MAPGSKLVSVSGLFGQYGVVYDVGLIKCTIIWAAHRLVCTRFCFISMGSLRFHLDFFVRVRLICLCFHYLVLVHTEQSIHFFHCDLK